MLSDAAFIMPLVAAAQTHAVFSEEPVYLIRWTVDDELNYMKTLYNGLDLKGNI